MEWLRDGCERWLRAMVRTAEYCDIDWSSLDIDIFGNREYSARFNTVGVEPFNTKVTEPHVLLN